MVEQDSEPDQQPGHDVAKGDDLEDKDVDRVQGRPDKVSLRKKLPGDENGAAALLQSIGNFRLGESAAEFRLAVLDLRVQVFGELGEDVLLLVSREPEADGLQVAVDQVSG
jgi:hypothetical protein